ncbi:MFS transporter [uncultured Fretibacterium sp.]|uniref:MFS transporter n=1 Tax=uncultured Fretibacterium sp. TaxID=1678694 RepID=UPI002627025A|nr:MFS transporter [uncultured Fretibacterium sp.]
MMFSGETFRSLQSRNFRLFMTSQVVSMTGIWMQRMATVWLVLSLTDSPFRSSSNDFASQIPILVLGLFSGALVDRIDKKHLIQATQFMLLLIALLMGFLTLSQRASYPIILMVSILLGSINAFDMPARQACISQMVDCPDCLANAIALNSAVFNLSRVIGPSVAGFIVAAVGEGYCFLLTGLAFLAPIYALFIMRLPPQAPPETPRPSVVLSIREGLAYVKENRHLEIVLLLMCAVSFLGMPIYVTFSALVKMVLREDASLFGLILSGVGLGALSSTMRIASARSIRGFPARMFWALIVMGVGLLSMALVRNRWILLPMSALVGGGLVYSTTGCNTMLQSFISDDMRGRVMSLYVMAFSGFAPLGSLAAGAIMSRIGVTWSILFQGAGCFLTAAVFRCFVKVLDRNIRALYGEKEEESEGAISEGKSKSLEAQNI